MGTLFEKSQLFFLSMIEDVIIETAEKYFI